MPVSEREECRIEAEADRRMDKLDAQLLNGGLSQAAYDAECRRLDRWTRRAHSRAETKRQRAIWARSIGPDFFRVGAR
jgi:hypothetical protein